jgi:alkylation response protein AidB-like acyl-CoA dehydrogenase
MFVFGLSEPGRGSDAANPQVTATKKGDSWVIQGEKCWSTNAHWASHVVVHALTDADAPNGKRSTCFIVPMDAKGVFYQEMSGKKLWEQSSTGSVIFDQVEVPESAVLGEVGGGFKVMVTTLNGGRLFIAGLALSSLAFALDKVRRYAEERIQFDEKPIGPLPARAGCHHRHGHRAGEEPHLAARTLQALPTPARSSESRPPRSRSTRAAWPASCSSPRWRSAVAWRASMNSG